MKNNFEQRIQLYNYMLKLLHVSQVGKFSIEFEEDTNV